jgi:hypothetical protein
MTREFRGMEEEPSQLEVVCMEARKRVAEWEPFSATAEQEDDTDFQFSMDMLGEYNDVIRSPRFNGSGFKVSSFRSPLSKLVESVEEGNDGHEDQNESDRVFYTGWNTPNIPSKAIGQNGSATKSAMNRSADEQLPSSMCFVKLSDMSADEWNVFLQNFQELLKEALHERARAAAGQRMKQRLGTSCKF